MQIDEMSDHEDLVMHREIGDEVRMSLCLRR